MDLITDATTSGSILQKLEKDIGDIYTICPVDSRQCYEIFLDENNIKHRLVHIRFYASAVAISCTKSIVRSLTETLLKSVLTTFNKGAYLMWRKRPELIIDGNKISISMRIGGL